MGTATKTPWEGRLGIELVGKMQGCCVKAILKWRPQMVGQKNSCTYCGSMMKTIRAGEVLSPTFVGWLGEEKSDFNNTEPEMVIGGLFFSKDKFATEEIAKTWMADRDIEAEEVIELDDHALYVPMERLMPESVRAIWVAPGVVGEIGISEKQVAVGGGQASMSSPGITTTSMASGGMIDPAQGPAATVAGASPSLMHGLTDPQDGHQHEFYLSPAEDAGGLRVKGLTSYNNGHAHMIEAAVSSDGAFDSRTAPDQSVVGGHAHSHRVRTGALSKEKDGSEDVVDGKKGKWVTMGGRAIFIAEGESAEDALSRHTGGEVDKPKGEKKEPEKKEPAKDEKEPEKKEPAKEPDKAPEKPEKLEPSKAGDAMQETGKKLRDSGDAFLSARGASMTRGGDKPEVKARANEAAKKYVQDMDDAVTSSKKAVEGLKGKLGVDEKVRSELEGKINQHESGMKDIKEDVKFYTEENNIGAMKFKVDGKDVASLAQKIGEMQKKSDKVERGAKTRREGAAAAREAKRFAKPDGKEKSIGDILDEIQENALSLPGGRVSPMATDDEPVPSPVVTKECMVTSVDISLLRKAADAIDGFYQNVLGERGATKVADFKAQMNRAIERAKGGFGAVEGMVTIEGEDLTWLKNCSTYLNDLGGRIAKGIGMVEVDKSVPSKAQKE